MILIATTTISLLGAIEDDVPGDPDDWGGAPDPETGYGVSASGIRAHLSSPGGGATGAGQVEQGGQTSTIEYRLLADPCAIRDDMRIRDESTGLEYQVNWSMTRPSPMPHVVAGVSRTMSTS